MTGQEFLNAFPVLGTWLQTGALALLLAVIVLGIRRKLPPETCPKKLEANQVKWLCVWMCCAAIVLILGWMFA